MMVDVGYAKQLKGQANLGLDVRYQGQVRATARDGSGGGVADAPSLKDKQFSQ
jgi:hypothetical protein